VKNKFDIEINDSSKKSCMFVDEVIRNEVIWWQFYGCGEEVEDFWGINL